MPATKPRERAATLPWNHERTMTWALTYLIARICVGFSKKDGVDAQAEPHAYGGEGELRATTRPSGDAGFMAAMTRIETDREEIAT